MKKLLLLALIPFIAVVSCRKDSSTNTPIDSKPDNDDTNPPTAQYYIKYKVDGVEVSETNITALRDVASNPRTLTIVGTGKDGANPKFRFFAEESIIGFVDGLSMGNDNYTFPLNYIEYTNSSGTLFSTQNDPDGITLGFFKLAYTKDGEARGVFDGKIQTATGTRIEITDGEFNVKISN